MSSGLGVVVDLINEIGDAALATAAKVVAANTAVASSNATTSGATGGPGASGPQMGSQGGPAGGKDTTSGVTGGGSGVAVPKFGTTSVIPLGAGDVIANLKVFGVRK